MAICNSFELPHGSFKSAAYKNIMVVDIESDRLLYGWYVSGLTGVSAQLCVLSPCTVIYIVTLITSKKYFNSWLMT